MIWGEQLPCGRYISPELRGALRKLKQSDISKQSSREGKGATLTRTACELAAASEDQPADVLVVHGCRRRVMAVHISNAMTAVTCPATSLSN